MIRTFEEFLNEMEGTPGNPPPQEKPPTPVNQNVVKPAVSQQQHQGDEAALLENVKNSIRKILEQRLYPALDKSHMNKQTAIDMLSSIAQEVASRYGLNVSQLRQAATAGMNPGGNPITPPMQPMAQ
jgi:hypothetical protein